MKHPWGGVLSSLFLLGSGFGLVALSPGLVSALGAWYDAHRPHGHLVVTPTTYDFRRTLSRHKLECRFVASNRGPGPLRLLDASGG